MQFQALLPCDPTASTVARTALDGYLAEPIDHERRDALRLATSELVSNAVRHSGCGPSEAIRLLVEMRTDLVRVEVEQATSTTNVAVERVDWGGVSGGFGLLIVESVSTRWGVTPGVPGRVWFEIAHAEAEAT
jgi:anti-sigma regulatory factor (Ser/Thr protein kinase)